MRHENSRHISIADDHVYSSHVTGPSISAGKDPVTNLARQCPICEKEDVSAVHIAAHLRRIASFALSYRDHDSPDKEVNEFCTELITETKDREEKTFTADDELKDFAQLEISHKADLESPGREKEQHDTEAQEASQDSRKAFVPETSEAPYQFHPAVLSQNAAHLSLNSEAQTPHTDINTKHEPVRADAPYVPKTCIGNTQGSNHSKRSSDGGSAVSNKVSPNTFYFESSGRKTVSFWFCCECSFGPHNSKLYDACINCGEERCSFCEEKLYTPE